jgi:hypothetical protein
MKFLDTVLAFFKFLDCRPEVPAQKQPQPAQKGIFLAFTLRAKRNPVALAGGYEPTELLEVLKSRQCTFEQFDRCIR